MTKPEKNSRALSRREFLRGAGAVAGGAALAPLALANACGRTSAQKTTAGGVDNTVAGHPTTSSTTPAGTSYDYAPPTTAPAKILIPGGLTYVALDRLYSVEHMWVKPLPDDYAVLGVTEKLVALMEVMETIELPGVGAALVQGSPCGSFEAHKLNSDFISPVSGTVVERNEFLVALDTQGQWIEPVNDSPYVGGWMLVVKLSRPQELDGLLTPEGYAQLQAKTTPA